MLVAEFIANMPKVELHVHLEGSIRPTTLHQLAQTHQLAVPPFISPNPGHQYHFRDFAHFVTVYDWLSACIQTPDDIEFITREFLAAQAAQRIYYSEVIYTPYTHYRKKGLTFADQFAAILRARRWAEMTLGVTMRLILDFARKAPVEEAERVAEWAIAGMADGVVGVGVGGMEAGYPAVKFRDVFARVRDAGLGCIPHAGETAGPTSIWEAITLLQATRIGHGVRCVEDPTLVQYLREQQIPLEVCPTSNVQVGVVPTLADHPFLDLLHAGVCVTINTDDPALFGTTLTTEYQQLADTFDLSHRTLERLVMNAVDACLLPTPEREQLTQTYTHAFQQLRIQCNGATAQV